MKPKGEEKKEEKHITDDIQKQNRTKTWKTINFDMQSVSMQQIQHKSMGLSFEVCSLFN